MNEQASIGRGLAPSIAAQEPVPERLCGPLETLLVAESPEGFAFLEALCPGTSLAFAVHGDAAVEPGRDALVLVNLGAPDSAALCRRLRARRSTFSPTLVAVALAAPDVADLLQAGADEVLLAGEPVELSRRRVERLARVHLLRREAALLRKALAAVPTGVGIAGAVENGLPLLLTNPAFEETTGLSAPRGLGRRADLLAAPDSAPGASESLAQALTEGESCRVVLQSRRSDGTAFWNEVELEPVAPDGAAPEHWVLSTVDVSERVRAAELERNRKGLEELVASRTMELAVALQSLDARRQFIETVLHALTAGVVVTDVDGFVTLANQAALRALGVSESACLGRSVRVVFGSNELLARALSEAMPGRERRLEIVCRTPQGRRVEMGITVIRVDPAGVRAPSAVPGVLPPALGRAPSIGYLLVFRDLGVERQFELEMRRVEGLTALGQMAAGIAHELRNPLAAMRSLTEILEVETPPSDERLEYVTRILSLLQRIERVVRNALRFAQPKPPTPKPVSPRALLEEALEILGPRLKPRGSRPALDAPDDLPLVDVDADQMVEVIVALLENALDSVGMVQRVRVRLGTVERRESATTPEAGFVSIEIVDDGPGIPDDLAGSIFDPFFTTKPKGTGLGLSIAQRLVRENGGHLTLSSRQGIETTFRILLPRVAS